MPAITPAMLHEAAGRHEALIEALPVWRKFLDQTIDGFSGDIVSHFADADVPEREAVPALFALACLVADCGGKGEATVVEGDLTIPDGVVYQVYTGDLHVKGDFAFGGVVIVLGDLVVDGTLRDWMEWSSLCVVGNVRCRVAHFGATVWVGGDVDANTLFLDRWSSLYARGTVRAPVAIRHDYDGEGFLCPVEGRVLDLEEDEEGFLAAVREEFVEDDWVDSADLVDAAVAGRPILRDDDAEGMS